MTEIEKTYRAYNFHLFKNKRKNSVLPKNWKDEVAVLQANESYPINKSVIEILNRFKSNDEYKINQFVVYCDAKQKLAFACKDNALLVMHDYNGTETVVFNDNLLRVEIELLEKNYISLDGHKTEIMQASEMKLQNAKTSKRLDLYQNAYKTKEIVGKTLISYVFDDRVFWVDKKYIDLVAKAFCVFCVFEYNSKDSFVKLNFGNSFTCILMECLI